jgi:ComF family protein
MAKGAIAAARDAATLAGLAFLDCFLPQFCAVCRHRISYRERLCPECVNLVRPEPVFFCPFCRFEGEDSGAADRVSGACGVHGGVSGRAAATAEPHILALVRRLKYSRERKLAGVLARLVLDSGIVDEHLRAFQVMCPVPLFSTRLRERGFNQSVEIARSLEADFGIPLVCDVLRKTRSTPEQARLGAKTRRRNLAGCFEVTRPSLVAGRDVLLVDDVITTGSTAVACIDALKTAGAARVAVVTVAA